MCQQVYRDIFSKENWSAIVPTSGYLSVYEAIRIMQDFCEINMHINQICVHKHKVTASKNNFIVRIMWVHVGREELW